VVQTVVITANTEEPKMFVMTLNGLVQVPIEKGLKK
jgi:hypothetical protein